MFLSRNLLDHHKLDKHKTLSDKIDKTKPVRSELYQDLCERLGKVHAERLSAVFGGRRIYISTVSSNCVVRFLGSKAAKDLVELYGRGYMYIPMAGQKGRKVSDKVIVRALNRGDSTNQIVDCIGVSRYRVEVVRKRYGIKGKSGNPGFKRSLNLYNDL